MNTDRVPMLAYDLPLRPNLVIRVTLPRDLTPGDAERLCGMIRALALGDKDGCTCPDVDVANLRAGERPFSRTVKGLDPRCPEHGAAAGVREETDG